MRLNPLRFVSYLSLALALLAAALALYLPKYAATEILFKKFQITPLAEEVDEGPLTLTYKNGTLFLPEGGKINFEKFQINLMPPSAELICKREGGALLRPDGKGLRVELNRLSCLSTAREVDGRLTVNPDGKIYGWLNLRGVKFENLSAESANFTFNGNTFSGRIRAMGVNLKGGGRIELNFGRGIYVNATFKGNGLTVNAEGYLPSPKVNLR